MSEIELNPDFNYTEKEKGAVLEEFNKGNNFFDLKSFIKKDIRTAVESEISKNTKKLGEIMNILKTKNIINYSLDLSNKRNCIKVIQLALGVEPVSGLYSRLTFMAVMNFQSTEMHGKSPDGIIDDKTLESLKSSLSGEEVSEKLVVTPYQQGIKGTTRQREHIEVGKKKLYSIGDSLAGRLNGNNRASGIPVKNEKGYSIVGASPEKVYSMLSNSLPMLNGKTVILSTGLTNDTNMLKYAKKQIDLLIEQGIDFRVLGVGTGVSGNKYINSQLAEYAGNKFIPIQNSEFEPGGIHPTVASLKELVGNYA